MQNSQALPKEYIRLLPKPVIPVLFENRLSEKQFVCGHCHLSFNLQSDLIHHLTVGNPSAKYEKISEGVSYICLQCNITFNSFKGMKQHFGKIHLNTKTFPCQICGKLFKDKYAAKFHKDNIHDDSKRVICSICNKICFNKYSLRIHFEKCLRKHEKE